MVAADFLAGVQREGLAEMREARAGMLEMRVSIEVTVDCWFVGR